jgi:recombination protein RecA
MDAKQIKKVAEELESALLEDLEEDTERLGTGCEHIDEILGGGVPVGRITEVVGDFSTGKSLLGLQLCRQNGAEGGVSIIIDSENSLDKKWVVHLGIDPETLIVADPTKISTLEDAYDYIRTVLKIAAESDQYFLIVWDTIAATPPKAVRTAEGSTMAVDARVNSQELRTLLDDLRTSQTTLVLINQLRDKPNVLFGQKWESFGGRAIRFYSTMRLHLKKGRRIKRGSDTLGFAGTLEVIKTKLGRPHDVAEFKLFFDRGIV